MISIAHQFKRWKLLYELTDNADQAIKSYEETINTQDPIIREGNERINIEDYRTPGVLETAVPEARGRVKLENSNVTIVTKDYEGEEQAGNKEIKFIPLWKWLLENK